jgi:hypothetical protein
MGGSDPTGWVMLNSVIYSVINLLRPFNLLKNKEAVMAGLVPAIQFGPTPGCVLKRPRQLPDVDPRDKPGDDDPFCVNGCDI